MLRAPNLYLEIFEFLAPIAPQTGQPQLNRTGFTHLALEVDDVPAAYAALEAAGVRWHTKPLEMADGYLMCYGRDPFDNVLEIQQTGDANPAAFSHLP